MKKINSMTDVTIGKAASKFLGEMFDEIYLVGGAIRDELLGRETNDLDYALPDSPREVIETLKSVGLQARDEAKEYGTISTKLGVFDIQITTYREESYPTGSRKPLTTHVKDIDSDLSRRDFTFNAMAVSKHDFVDPYGGYEDIEHRVIRTVGDADARFTEDPLRILRAYRFVAQLGFELDDKVRAASEENAGLVIDLSGARIGGELSKLLTGPYWADSLVEAANSGVLTHIFRDHGGTITAELIEGYLENYSLAELDALDDTSRWALLISLVAESKVGKNHASKALGIVEPLVRHFELGKSQIPLIEQACGDIQKKRNSRESREARIERLEKELDESLVHKDLKHNTIKADLLLEYAKKDFRHRNFSTAKNRLEESIGLIDENFSSLLENTPSDVKAYKASKYRVHYFARYKYLLACIIRRDNILDKLSDVEAIKKVVLKKIPSNSPFAISDKDWLLILEEAIVLILKVPDKLHAIGSLDDFLSDVSKSIPAERRYHLRKNYFYRIARSQESSSKEKATAYERILSVLVTGEVSQSSEEYLDAELDYRIWSCLAANTIKNFWEEYDQLEEVATRMLDIRSSESVKKSYLATASVLAHALSLSQDVNEKYEISRMIVSHYLMSRTSAGKRNAKRFRIYMDWFQVLSKIIEVKTVKEIPGLISQLRSVKALGYIDEDEQYFTENLKELSDTRYKLAGVIEFLNYLVGNMRLFEYDGDAALKGISVLLDQRLMSYRDSLAALKNWCKSQVLSSTQGLEVERIAWGVQDELEDLMDHKSENVTIVERGEGNQVELKASFHYDLETKQRDLSNLPFSSIKTVVGFLNTSGGRLFIGVNDRREIIGLEQSDFKALNKKYDIPKKIDEMMKIIDQRINDDIGMHNVDYIKLSWEQYQERTFIVVKVEPSKNPVFYRGEKFFVRASSGTREINGPEMMQYVKDHFSD